MTDEGCLTVIQLTLVQSIYLAWCKSATSLPCRRREGGRGSGRRRWLSKGIRNTFCIGTDCATQCKGGTGREGGMHYCLLFS